MAAPVDLHSGPSAEVSTATDAPPIEAAPPWRTASAIGFRLFALYVLLSSLPIPDFGLVAWFGHNVLGVTSEIVDEMTGSGDMTFHYVQLAVVAVVSVLGCAVWTVLRSGPKNYDRWLYWLSVFVRYFLALAMLGYGFAKVFKSQFSDPSIERLIQPYGESSPMGLAWTFMGYSLAYNVFTGMGEVVAGILLWWRRTTTLGALIGIGVMSNVVMLNFGYDIPVKLFSMHLLLLFVFLVGLDVRRVLGVLVFNRPVPAADLSPVLRRRWARVTRVVLKSVMQVLVLALGIGGMLYMESQEPPPMALRGLYEVETFRTDGVEHPPLLTDETRWRRFIVDRHDRVIIEHMGGKKTRFRGTLDAEAHTLTLVGRSDEGEERETLATYRELAEGGLAIEVEIDGQHIEAEMSAVDLQDFLLVSRGFRWVNEYPYNR